MLVFKKKSTLTINKVLSSRIMGTFLLSLLGKKKLTPKEYQHALSREEA
jgi:hypothetical protein